MRADRQDFSKLAVLFARYGVEPFLESTNLLVAVLDRDGILLSWNPSFNTLIQSMPERRLLKDFLLLASKPPFDTLLAKTVRGRARTQGNLEFVYDGREREFSSLFVPLPEERVLFIAEPSSSAADLEAITAELHRTRQSLERKDVELKAVLVQADEVSHTDELTFLPNRKQIIGDLQREVLFSDRYGTPLAISMLDIDHFKRINDTHGHAVGDDILRSLAGELRQHIRHPDTIGRYGGEEFLVVLPHSTVKAATEQAERLCRYVRSLVIESGEHKISLTISMGVAQYKTHKEDWQALLKRADAALYQAKNSGRDRWEVSEE